MSSLQLAKTFQGREFILGPIRFVFAIVWFAIGLAVVGSLKEGTLLMAKQAATTHQRGGISFGKWNRQLVGGKYHTDFKNNK